MRSLCNNWEFIPGWFDEFSDGEGMGTPVRLPHTVKEIPLHYADHQSYQMICGYRRNLVISPEQADKRLFLQFDGAAHIATVYVNGKELAHHRCGYTAFRVEITEAVRTGNNCIAVKLDTTENPEVPPFGFVIDYLTYGGLYREVWLDERERSYIQDLYITTPDVNTLKIKPTLVGAEKGIVMVELLKGERLLIKKAFTAGGVITIDCPDVKPWSIEHPVLYTCRVSLLKVGRVMDVQQVRIGFRTAEFKADGFYLNGKKTFLRGLNRHQCWPYVGYAAPESLQREDARILKEELGCVAVRTSHYPQSQYFIDECDKLGLLVFTEIPGWQHIGSDPAWKDQVVQNTREMVTQYRNHPSIIVWGVRINESQDDDELYKLTNSVARELDPSRATTGVRFFEKSSLLEDVYSYNDFSHTGDNPGCKPKKNVTPDMKKALLITEHNGHMFPTKSFDHWGKRQEQALRHMRVQNDAAADGAHAGCFGWCMFDYPTHKDFGSGDRVCYHGVMDAFRNPKLAAYAYASQGEQQNVLAVGSSMDIGDYPGGQIGNIYVFTNADTVELYKNGEFVTLLKNGGWKGLPHGPMLLDDTVGCLLETQEGFDPQKAKLLREALLAIRNKGLANLSPADMAKMGYAMMKYGMKYADAVALYGKYIGNWGGEATVWRLDAKLDGELVATCTCCPSAKLHLEVTPSHTTLTEGDSYDMAAVRIRILDEYGNPAPYAQLPVQFALEGPAELVGPAVVTAEGGMTGTYIKTTGKSGEVKLTVTTAQTEPVTLEFSIA